MNIQDAKTQIKNAITAYFAKDEFDNYLIPLEKQRPVFLMGPPGIGKTAIMEQIASELGVGLISYSMTHHTRQSALGLPFIVHKNYDGLECDVSEYTMSEIIASVYDMMKSSGIREGILFLDEINCVSETLAPSMLQFLQYKVFGRHQVPDGWVIVTAGNPPEYNRSVREFDVVTLDRLKVLKVEPDLAVWREYALQWRVHGAVLNYLDIHKDHFYVMEMTTQGRSYVTARGWEDLSGILQLYEEEELPVTEELVGQYLHNEQVVKEFTAYYELYNKYKRDYRIADILEGQASPNAIGRAKAAAFDERLSLLGMLCDRIQADMAEVMEQADYIQRLLQILKNVKEKAPELDAEGVCKLLSVSEEGLKNRITSLAGANTLSDEERRQLKLVIRFLEEGRKVVNLSGVQTGEEAFAQIRSQYEKALGSLQKETQAVGTRLHHLFVFADEAFEGGNEMLILVTELTVGKASSRFIATFGSEDYAKHNEELMLSERGADLQSKIGELGL